MFQNNQDKPRRFSLEKIILYVFLIASVVINVLLALETKDLKRKLFIAELGQKESQLIVGKVVSPLEVENLAGEKKIINYRDQTLPTVIYFFSPDCSWSHRNLQNAKVLFENTKGKFNFVSVSAQTDDLQTYVQQNDIAFPVFGKVKDESRAEYAFRATPSTYVIENDGKVIKLWSGAYTGKIGDEVEKFFNLKLAGLSE